MFIFVTSIVWTRKILSLCFKEERTSYRFVMTSARVNDDRILTFDLTILYNCVFIFCHNYINFFICRCKSGIKIVGSSTSDAICKNGSEIVMDDSKIHITTLKTISSATPRTMASSSTARSNTTPSSSNKEGSLYSFGTLSSLLSDI